MDVGEPANDYRVWLEAATCIDVVTTEVLLRRLLVQVRQGSGIRASGCLEQKVAAVTCIKVATTGVLLRRLLHCKPSESRVTTYTALS